MNKRAKKLFVVILDNQLIYCNTNLKALHDSAIAISGYTDSYVTLFRRFQAADAFILSINDKEYHFQKFVSIISPDEEISQPIPKKQPASPVKKDITIKKSPEKEPTMAELLRQVKL